MVQTLRSHLRSVYIYGPKSFLTLILIGFGFVALPLIFALIYSAFHVERLADKSQVTVYTAVQATQNTRMLLEQLTGMERSARQYHVLKDPAFLHSYEEKHQAFQKTLGILTGLTARRHHPFPITNPRKSRKHPISRHQCQTSNFRGSRGGHRGIFTARRARPKHLYRHQ